jgi:hypothetical protein
VRRQLLLIAASLLPACGVSLVRAERDLTLSQAHVPRSQLVVRTHNGAIRIQGDPHAGAVTVAATLVCGGKTQAEADTRVVHASVAAERAADGTLTVAPRFPGGPRPGDGASLSVRLPDASGTVAETTNGSVKVILLAGDLKITTSNGGIGVIDHGGPVQLETSNGGILARNIDGPVTATTSNGTIVAESIRGHARLQSSNGGITLTLAPDQAGPVSATTTNGVVAVSVGPAFTGRVQLKTSNGHLSVDDRAGRVVSKSLDKRTGTIQVGEGGAASIVTTSNGNVRFVIRR